MADVAAYGLVPGNLVEREETVRLAIEQVTPNYFDVLGVRAAQGRLLRSGEADDRAAVVVLGHALWQTRFGADPGIVGRTVRINSGTFTVVGVAPEGFKGSQRIFGGVDAWVPLETLAGGRPIGSPSAARARCCCSAGCSRACRSTKRERATRSSRNQLLASYPDEWRDVTSRGRAITILPESESRVPPGDRGAVVGFFGLLLAGFALVLLICCVNVANLLLARASGRVRDVAIRVSLGASRARLVRQLMTESVALAALGCAGAVLVTYAAARLLSRWRPPGDLKLDVAVDWRVLAFALAAAVVAAVTFGPRARAEPHAARRLVGAEGRRARHRRHAALRIARRADHGASIRFAGAARVRRPVPAQLATGRDRRSRLRRGQRRDRVVRSPHAGLHRGARPSVL
jgi:hypothetical protein